LQVNKDIDSVIGLKINFLVILMRKVGILVIGVNGAISSMMTTGIFAIRKGLVPPLGLVTELPEFNSYDWLSPESVVFGGWDFRSTGTHYEWVKSKNLIDPVIVESIRDDLEGVEIFDAPLCSISPTIMSLEGARNTGRKIMTQKDAIQKIRKNIRDFIERNYLDRAILVNLSSIESVYEVASQLSDIDAFKKAIDMNESLMPASVLYAYASILEGCPMANFTPNLAFEVPALIQFAEKQGVPLAGRDGKTGQTLYKTVIAPMLKWRNLKLEGWYSTNILGNDDGKVLHDPKHAVSKIKTKSDVLPSVLGYNDFSHQVHIHYYPVRGDAKEAWDSIDFMGWLGTKMSMKINWLGQDSALAAPLVFDLVRFLDRASRENQSGVLSYLACFFKAPSGTMIHDFFAQIQMLQNEFKKGCYEEQATH
jgi:myo-inositol-1-phosphate synthase